MQWFISNLPSYPINTFGSDQSLTLYHWSVKKVPDTPALHRATGTTYDTHWLPLNSLLRDKRRMRTIEHLVMNAQSHTHFPAGQVDSDERSIGRLPPARRHLRFLPPAAPSEGRISSSVHFRPLWLSGSELTSLDRDATNVPCLSNRSVVTEFGFEQKRKKALFNPLHNNFSEEVPVISCQGLFFLGGREKHQRGVHGRQ